MTSTLNQFRIAICGAGIGGLALAVIIGNHDSKYQIDIYEAADKFATIGAGVVIWSRTRRIFEELGLDDVLDKFAIPTPGDEKLQGYAFRYGHQKEPGTNFHELIVPPGTNAYHRADVLKVFSDSLPENVEVHFSKKMKSFKESSSGKVYLTFSDEAIAEADLLIGSDGLNSATRASMYQAEAEKAAPECREGLLRHVEPTFSGTMAFRGLVPSEMLNKIYPSHQTISKAVMYLGRDQHITTYPISPSQGRFVNVVAYVTDFGREGTRLSEPSVIEISKEEALEHFRDWEPEVKALLSCCLRSSRWAISTIPDLPCLVSGHVVLLGDSAHAKQPFSGSGANDAIQDAYILGKILTNPKVSKENIRAALKIYESIRLPVIRESMEKTKLCGYILESRYPPEILDKRDSGLSVEELRVLSDGVYNQWRWQWETSIDEDWKKAEEQLSTL